MNRVDLKIVLLGKEYGGKTSLVERYLNDRFLDMPYQNTIGAAFGAKRVEINSKKITLGIWDTAGGERYEAMSRIYYRGALAAVVCYDLTDISSFERAKFWVNELKKTEESCRVYLCGTKKDIIDENPAKKQVPTSQIYQYAADVDADIFETSSKSGENVKELFLKIADDYITETKHREAPVSQQQSINLSTRDKKSFSCCQ